MVDDEDAFSISLSLACVPFGGEQHSVVHTYVQELRHAFDFHRKWQGEKAPENEAAEMTAADSR